MGIILCDDKENTGMVGRRAELISANNEAKKFIIIDLTSSEFKLIIMDLDLSMYYKLKEWRYDKNFYYKSNLEKFFLIVEDYLNNESIVNKIIGNGVSASGSFGSAISRKG